MHVLKLNFYCMSPTNSSMLCYVTLQGYITANMQTHADAIAVKQETSWFPQIKQVGRHGRQDKGETLSPFPVSRTMAHTSAHRCFHEVLSEIWGMSVSIRSQQSERDCHRETLLSWIVNAVWLTSVATPHRTPKKETEQDLCVLL